MTDTSLAPSALAPSQISAVFPGLRLLVVEDLVALAIQYRTIATRLEVQTVTAGTVAQAKRHIADGPWHAALVDLNLPDGTGFDVLRLLRKEHPACSVVVITAEDSLDNAVRASEAGAFDFIEKPVEAERLTVTLRNALNASLLAQRVASYQVEAPRQFEQFLGQSAEMQTVYKMIETVAGSNAPVCITGESGTGKELAANAIHARSPRRAKNFVAINCAAIPKDLIESELFGHGKGANTSAESDLSLIHI
jgi:DNA-binding NtrC family response regulator